MAGSYTAAALNSGKIGAQMAFSCVVVTPEQQILDESLTQAIIPAVDGLLGILTNRAPLLAKLGKGPLRLDLASGQKRLFRIEGGVAQMKDNKLTILTTTARDEAKG
jgi:F-type H+-transporting ATPase subunit epsilon